MSFPRYPQYKASGVEWLGDVPEGWEVKKIKHLASRISSGKTPLGGGENYVDQGVVFLRSQNVYDEGLRLDDVVFITDEVDEDMASSRVKPNDILLNITGASIGRSCVVPSSLPNANVNQHVCAIRLKCAPQVPFVGWVFRSDVIKIQVDQMQNGAAREGLNFWQIGSMSFALPSAAEQLAIVELLERETAKIDGLVADYRLLMELLKEKRQAVISQAVTKGLDPHAPMKPSGIEWLGDVPLGWKTGPIKRHIARVESGTSVNSSDEPAGYGKLGVLKTSCVYRGRFEPSENKTVLLEDINRVSCPLKAGTLIVSRMNTPELIGAAGLVVFAPSNLYLPDRLWQIYFSDVEVRFIYFWTLTRFYRAQVESVCTGTSSSMKNLAQSQFGSFTIAIPPTDEQAVIASFLVRETAKFDALTADAQQAIDLLQERRSALISAAVTGQIDVRQQPRN